MAETIEEQQSQEPEIKCNPQLAEISQPVTLPSGGGCSGSPYTIETPLLVSGWQNATATVTSSDCACTPTTSNDGTKVIVSFSGSRPNPCLTEYTWKTTYTMENVEGGAITSFTDSGAGLGEIPTGGYPDNSAFPPETRGVVVLTKWDGTTRLDGRYFNDGLAKFVAVSSSDIQKVSSSAQECFNCRVTVKYEGCSSSPSGGYDPSNPPAGSPPPPSAPPSGSPPSSPPPSNPPQPPPNRGGGGFPPPSAGNPPPPSAPPPSPPPKPPEVRLTLFGTPWIIPAGVDPSYPSGTTLYPQPNIYMPALTAIFPGGEIFSLPWNGYLTWFGAAAGTTIVSGNNFPAWYVSPQMSQKVFDNWKVLKHATIQFENTNTQIHTSMTTTDALLYGKSQQKFDANLAIIYNDQQIDQVVYDLYRYDNGRWTLELYPKHNSPKSLDKFVVFKEPLQGVSNSYQIAVHSSDPNTWKLVGWQIEGKLKGKRTSHSRD